MGNEWGNAKPGQICGFDADGNRVGIDPPQSNGWIDRRQQEPDAADTIIVWDERAFQCPMSCCFDYGEWCEIGDKRAVTFRYWQPAPRSPYSEGSP